MSKSNGTHVAVEFEDWSERPQPSRSDLVTEIERLKISSERLRLDYADARQSMTRLHQAEVAERSRANLAEHECLRLLRQQERVPKRIRSFFDRIHRIRRAWEYVTRTNQA